MVSFLPQVIPQLILILVNLLFLTPTTLSGPVPTNRGGFRLRNGLSFPAISFGTAGLSRDTEVAVQTAIEAGFTSFDTAQAWEW